MNPDIYKKKLPTYSMSGRNKEYMDKNPGPAAYKPKVPFTSAPKYTFGVKHSDFKGYYALDDEEEV
jgi:hypothetical protein